jgi:hypothetical protein
LEKIVEAHLQIVSQLELWIIANQIDDYAMFQLEIADARAQHDKALNKLKRHRAVLGVEQVHDLQRLRKNKYLILHMNAFTLKTRIHECLRQRKFELEHIEWAYRQTLAGQ